MSTIELINPLTNSLLTEVEGGLKDEQGVFFPYIAGAYRIAGDNNYTENFGFQWNKFTKTQIDRESASSHQSKARFFAQTGWDKQDLTGQIILEAGSGAGRFSQIVLDFTKATLYSVDYSNSVEANYKNNGHHKERLKLFQASVYELPFKQGSFDKVFCFGVLQHTPDVKKSVQSLAAMVKPGGELAVDFYPIRGWWTKVHIKYILRPFTKKMSHDKLLGLIERNMGWLIKASNFFNKIGIGRLVNRFLPICDIKATLPPGLSKQELKEWCILDTFDMFSPEYDQPQKIKTVESWFKEMGFKNITAGFVKFDNNAAAVVKGTR
jgi:SAM-dependent methyltransferase